VSLLLPHSAIIYLFCTELQSRIFYNVKQIPSVSCLGSKASTALGIHFSQGPIQPDVTSPPWFLLIHSLGPHWSSALWMHQSHSFLKASSVHLTSPLCLERVTRLAYSYKAGLIWTLSAQRRDSIWSLFPTLSLFAVVIEIISNSNKYVHVCNCISACLPWGQLQKRKGFHQGLEPRDYTANSCLKTNDYHYSFYNFCMWFMQELW
jgi:hypothetical protein